MIATDRILLRRWLPVGLLGVWISLAPLSAGGLRTVERQFNSYRGARTFTCLAVDGGIVPLVAPAGVTVAAGEDLAVSWADGTRAVIRPATADEVALFEMRAKPDGAAAWEKYVAGTLRDAAQTYTVRDFEPAILEVNHWQMAAMAIDYQFGGVKSSCLLLLWRCKDGSTLAVTMRSDFATFKAQREVLYSMLGSSMLVPEAPAVATP